MKLSDYVYKFLAEKGVDTVFYLPGGGCMHLLDSMGRNENIQQFLLLHEQAVAIAVESYAATTGKIGCGLVTTGPGATNTITGITAAFIDSTPCIFITGQVKTADLKSNYGVRALGNQEADIVSIAAPVTKYATMITDKNKIRYELEKAFYEAENGRKGPVLLDIPLDIQSAVIDENNLESFTPPVKEKTVFDVEKLRGLIKKAKRPVIIAGNGVRSSKENFIKLIEKLNIPVILSWKALDLLPDSHPLNSGRTGGMGDRYGNLTVQNSDLLISLGCKLDFSITGYDRKKWAVNAEKVIVDIDKTELDKIYVDVTMRINGDVSEVIDNLLDFEYNNKYEEWFANIRKWKEKYPVLTAEKCFKGGEKITTYGFIKLLCENLDDNAFVAPCSAGTTAEIFFQAFNVKSNQTIRSNHGLGSMGFDIPNAIGMCIASGKKTTICVTSDGGVQLNIQELATIKGNNLPVKLFIINNNGYASIRNMQNNNFNSFHVGCDETAGLFLPNFEKIAAAYEINYAFADSKITLETALKNVLDNDKPFICEVKVVGDCVVNPRTATIIEKDGTIHSSPLENQFPFLSEEELAENKCSPQN